MNEANSLASVVVLTGSIGSGKSSAAKFFADCGASVISADALAREIVQPNTPALNELRQVFGSDILTVSGELDRKKLAALVFKDPHKRITLEAITHPRIHELALKRFEEETAKHPPLMVYECPLFFEAELAKKGFGPVVVIVADDAIAKARVMARDKLSAEAVDARLKLQMPTHEKASRADYLLDNSGTLEQLQQQVRILYDKLVAP